MDKLFFPTNTLATILVIKIKADAFSSQNPNSVTSLISAYSGRIINLAKEKISIAFTVNDISEKHTLRGFSLLNKIRTEFPQVFEAAILHVEEIINDGLNVHLKDIEILEELSHVLDEIKAPHNHILFSDNAKNMLEDELHFSKVLHESLLGHHGLFVYESTKSQAKNKRHFLGRNIELKILNNYFDVKNDNLKKIILTGEPGVGKSSLVETYLEAKTENTEIIKFRFFEFGYEAPFDLILRTLSQSIFANEKVSEKDLSLNDLEDKYLNNQFQEAGHTSIISIQKSILNKLFNLVPSDKKIYFFLDDIQWASEDFINLFSALQINESYFVIATSREKPSRIDSFDVLPISRLPKSAVESICYHLLPPDQLNKEKVDLIFKKTGGNPFYISEIIRFIEQNDEILKLDFGDYLVENKLPITLINLVNFMIENFDEKTKQVLFFSSCVGHAFESEIITKCLESNISEITNILDNLVNDNFLAKSQFGQYQFTHKLKEQAVYNSLSASSKKNLHYRLGIVSQGDNRSARNSEFIARQFFFSGNWKKSYNYNLAVGKNFLKNLDANHAADAFAKCLISAKKLGHLSKTRELRLRLWLCKAYFIAGNIKLAGKFIREISSLILRRSSAFSQDIRNEALSQITFYHWVSANYQQSLDIIDQYVGPKRVSWLTDQTSYTLLMRKAGMLSDMGRFNESNDLIDGVIERILQLAKDQAWKAIFSIPSALYAIKARNMACLKNKLAFVQNSDLALSDQFLSHPTHRIFALCYISDGYLQLKDVKNAQINLDEALKLAHANDIKILESYLLSMDGYCSAYNHKPKATYKIMRAINMAEKSGKKGRLSLYYLFLARASILETNRSSLKRALNKGCKIAERQSEMWVLDQLQSLSKTQGIFLRDANSQSNILSFRARG